MTDPANDCPANNLKETLADPIIIQQPYDYFLRMRKEDPVHFDAGIGMFIVSRYDDVMEILRSPLKYSSELGFVAHRQPYDDEIDEMMSREGYGRIPENIVSLDPPAHSRIRSLIEMAFSAHVVAAMEGYIETISHELIDRFQDRGAAEIVEEFAIPLPMWVIADQLGVSRADLPHFKRWSDASIEPLGRILSRERAFACARDLVEMSHYLVAVIAERRAHPGGDLISALVHARIDDDLKPELDQTELLGVIRALLVAGNETTTTAIINSVLLLIEHPDAFLEIRADNPDRSKALTRMTEESLRLRAPVTGLPRVAMEDSVVGGTHIPKGSSMLLCYASANRDELKFGRPDCFDPGRKESGRHLAFGGGIHRCVGAMLARMEIKCAMRAIVDRLDNIRLAVNPAELHYRPSIVTRTLASLPITFTNRSWERH